LSEVSFSSLNIYERMVFISADSPEELTLVVRRIPTRIKLIGNPTFDGKKWYWWVIGDVRGIRKILNKKDN